MREDDYAAHDYIGVSPFHAAGTLSGFVISGRWPNTTK